MPGMAPDSVMGLLLAPDAADTPGSFVALVTKNRPPHLKGLLLGPGGKVEAGELPMDAVAREVTEECGVTVPAGSWRRVARLYREDGYTVWVYAVFLADMPRLKFPKDEPVLWYDVEKLPENVHPSVRWLVPLATDGSIAAEVNVHFRAPPGV